jgi:hypothetical protein
MDGSKPMQGCEDEGEEEIDTEHAEAAEEVMAVQWDEWDAAQGLGPVHQWTAARLLSTSAPGSSGQPSRRGDHVLHQVQRILDPTGRWSLPPAATHPTGLVTAPHQQQGSSQAGGVPPLTARDQRAAAQGLPLLKPVHSIAEQAIDQASGQGAGAAVCVLFWG